MKTSKRWWLLILVALVFWLIGSFCSCSRLMSILQGPRREATTAPVAVAWPSPVPTPTPLTPATPTLPGPTPGLEDRLTAPSEPNTEFEIEMTQKEINDYLRGQTFEQEGVTIENVDVTVTEREIIAHLRATHHDTGLSAGLKALGVPKVVDNQLYVEISNLSLDESVTGFARLIAQALIGTLVEESSTSYGVPIPLPEENADITDVTLLPGAIRVVGRTR